MVVQELLEVVEQLKTTGLTMIIVEQSLNVALSVAERAVFMEKGRVRFEGAGPGAGRAGRSGPGGVPRGRGRLIMSRGDVRRGDVLVRVSWQ